MLPSSFSVGITTEIDFFSIMEITYNLTYSLGCQRLFYTIYFAFTFSLSTLAKYWPVYDLFTLATSSGAHTAITSPPLLPPSGPRSITQSAYLITSTLCAIPSTEFRVYT